MAGIPSATPEKIKSDNPAVLLNTILSIPGDPDSLL